MKRISILGLAMVLLVSLSAFSRPKAEPPKPEVEGKAAVEPEPISKFKEAPMLSEMVAAGKLPAVEDRLPLSPLVVKPSEAIGTYGGSLAIQISNPHGWEPGVALMVEHVIAYGHQTDYNLGPNIAANWTVSEDGKVFTLFLREGIKWSDGNPLIADDFVFFWEDVAKNMELTPAMPGFLNVKLPVSTVKLDDYTVRFTYDEPYYIAPNMFSFGNYGCVGTSHLPKHVYQEWHIKYNPDAEKIAKEADFESWWQFFNSKRIIGIMNPQIPGIPSLGPWVIKDSNPSGAVWERNPFYFKVDPEGNQLPYIDEVIGIYLGDSEANLLRTMNGEFDYVTYALNIDDFPILKENADAAGYDVRIAEGNMVSDVAFRVNWNHVGDPEVAKILYDKRFRQALSVAIDRDEVNELVSLGYGIPMQFTLKKDSRVFKQEWAEAYAQYDPDLAGRLLDEIGMKGRDSDGFRLTPSGKNFEFIVEIMSNSTACAKASELIKDYWESVGIRVNLQIKEIMAVVQNLANKTFMVFGQEMPSWSDLGMITDGIETWNSWAVFNDWWAWRQYDGEQGTEPPEDIKRIFEINALRASVPMEQTFESIEWVFDWVAENLPVIGVMGYTGTPVVWKKNLGNVDHTYPAEGSYRAETFFWKK